MLEIVYDLLVKPSFAEQLNVQCSAVQCSNEYMHTHQIIRHICSACVVIFVFDAHVLLINMLRILGHMFRINTRTRHNGIAIFIN